MEHQMNHSEINNQFKRDFFALTDTAQSIVVTSHISPDDDSIASVLAMYRLLTDKYPDKSVRMVYTGEQAGRYQYFQNFDRIEFVEDLADHLEGVDTLIMLDGGGFGRFTARPEAMDSFTGKTICIDHHHNPTSRFDLSLICPSVYSTSEILYLQFFKELQISKQLAEILLLGILGDTGNFAYLDSSQTETFVTAKHLVEISGVRIQELQSHYRLLSPRVFTGVQELVKNTEFRQVVGWPDLQTSRVEREFIGRMHYTDKEISEASGIYVGHFLQAIVGYGWGFVISPKLDGSCGISLRSLPKSVNVRELVERMGIGGGHDRAAGGTFKVGEDGKPREVDECLEEVLEWMRENDPSFA